MASVVVIISVVAISVVVISKIVVTSVEKDVVDGGVG